MSHSEVVVIGIDSAVQPKNNGLALGRFKGQKVSVQEVKCGDDPSPLEIICGWLENAERALLALDAPLGWPASLGTTLIGHRAGQGMTSDSNQLFRRATDNKIREVFHKHPLEVGADRIARTAVAALKLLEEVRDRTGKKIPLAWNADFESYAAIEVYPAATLRAHRIDSAGYKAPVARKRRREILKDLNKLLEIEVKDSRIISSSDTLDAVICLLAAQDFLQSKCIFPEDHELAAKEGWIWVRKEAC